MSLKICAIPISEALTKGNGLNFMEKRSAATAPVVEITQGSMTVAEARLVDYLTSVAQTGAVCRKTTHLT